MAQDLPEHARPAVPANAPVDRPEGPTPRDPTGAPGLYRLDAAALVDPHQPPHAVLAGTQGVSLVVERTPGGELLALAAGPRTMVASSSRFATAKILDRHRCVLTPALVNAHTHLDLTHIGPRPLGERGFDAWLDMVRRERRQDAEGIAQSVREGIALLKLGGTALVGDIAGAVGGRASGVAAAALRDELRDGRADPPGRATLAGISLIEFFAMGPRWRESTQSALEVLRTLDAGRDSGPAGVGPSCWRAGLSPHAPYSVHARSYALAAEGAAPGVAVVTHAAESLAERRFIARGDGPLAGLLDGLGLLDEHARSSVGMGRSPVAHLDHSLSDLPNARLTLVHACDLSDNDIQIIARRGWRVIYCPRAAAYFAPAHAQRLGTSEAPLPPHRYRDLLAAGVPVGLGTDSIVNLPPEQVARTGLSVWDEMALLVTRDGLNAHDALRMATVHGCAALGIDDQEVARRFRLAPEKDQGPQPIAGVLATPILGDGSQMGESTWLEGIGALETGLKNGGKPEHVAGGSVSLLS